MHQNKYDFKTWNLFWEGFKNIVGKGEMLITHILSISLNGSRGIFHGLIKMLYCLL